MLRSETIELICALKRTEDDTQRASNHDTHFSHVHPRRGEKKGKRWNMSPSNISTGDRKAFYEQLTADNAAVLLVDHQVGLFTGVVDIDVLTLKHNVVALAKAARVLGVPTIVTATAPDSLWGPNIPELLTARPDLEVLARTTVNPWDEPRFTQAVEALGRKKLIIAGVSTEVCRGLTAFRAVSRGYDVYWGIAASGTLSLMKRETRILRLMQAGHVVAD